MKKILSTILLLCTSLPAMAFEDLMIVSDEPVRKVFIQDSSIADVRPVFTISNEKKIILVTPLKSGKTVIVVDTTAGAKSLELKVSRRNTTINQQDGFTYFSMDMPPEAIDIPLPPVNEDLKERK